MGCIWLLMGCAEVVVPGAMTGGGEYYRYTTSNIAKETLMGDVRDVTAAARSALPKMGIRLHSVTPYTDETVMFASTPEHWQTQGWFSLSAGQKKHIADTHNRYIYFYAETRLQDQMYWGGENFHWFEGKRFGFFKADFGNDSEDFTQSFSCD